MFFQEGSGGRGASVMDAAAALAACDVHKWFIESAGSISMREFFMLLRQRRIYEALEVLRSVRKGSCIDV